MVPALFLWFLSALVTLVWLTPALALCRFTPRTTQQLLKHWNDLQLRIFGIRITVTDRNDGRYDSPPYLFVHLNQTSLSEIFVIEHSLPAEFNVLMNIEYALLPFIGWILWLMGGVVLVRQWPQQARRAIEKTTKLMRKGRNFYMSIEGRRSPDGSLGPYRKGGAILAINTQATIIPIVIHGARDILPYGEWRVKPGPVEIILCEAISTEGLTLENRHELMQRLQTIAIQERCNREKNQQPDLRGNDTSAEIQEPL